MLELQPNGYCKLTLHAVPSPSNVKEATERSVPVKNHDWISGQAIALIKVLS